MMRPVDRRSHLPAQLKICQTTVGIPAINDLCCMHWKRAAPLLSPQRTLTAIVRLLFLDTPQNFFESVF
jgi:hypothetical protein